MTDQTQGNRATVCNTESKIMAQTKTSHQDPDANKPEHILNTLPGSIF
jgi:hypothetical protein